MPKKIGKMDRNVLLNAVLPQKTKSYTVITHGDVISTIEKGLQTNNFVCEAEEFKCTKGAQVAHGSFILNYENDPELSLMYSFSNSYDKSLRFRAAIGARILLNGAYMIAEADSWKRKHTGTADDEMENLIASHLSNAGVYFNNLVEAKNAMKQITIDMNTFGSIIGELFISDLLTIDQISVVKKEYESPSYEYPDGENNLWTCYNHIINSLKTSHPKVWMHNQIAIHMYFCARFDLVTYDKEVDEIQPVSIVDVVDDDFVLPGFETDVESSEQVNNEEIVSEIERNALEEEVILPNSENDFSELDNPSEVELPPIETDKVVENNSKSNPNQEVLNALKEAGLPTPTAILDVSETNEIEVTIPKIEESIVESTEVISTIVESEAISETTEVSTETQETAEIIYFPTGLYEGLKIGDTFEESDDYYNIVSIETIDGEEYYACNKLTFEGEVTTVDKHESIVETVEPETVSEPEIKPEIDTEKAEELSKILESKESKTIIHAAIKDPIHDVISIEIEEIYGSPQEFTYDTTDTQYNIKLVTGESVTLSRSYIDAKL